MILETLSIFLWGVCVLGLILIVSAIGVFIRDNDEARFVFWVIVLIFCIGAMAKYGTRQYTSNPQKLQQTPRHQKEL